MSNFEIRVRGDVKLSVRCGWFVATPKAEGGPIASLVSVTRLSSPLRCLTRLSLLIGLISGCHLVLPKSAHEPIIRNPFPQLSRVAVAPFINHSDEPTVDGREVALAYFTELQSTPGFEVVPLGVVEETMLDHRIDLSDPGEARRLAQLLAVDAVIVGSVTDYSPYYPPRVGLRTEWYAANPGFHEIPAGYGLAWGTPEEEFIPDDLVYESQMALARSTMAQETPDCYGTCQELPAPPGGIAEVGPVAEGPADDRDRAPAVEDAGDGDSNEHRDVHEQGGQRATPPSASAGTEEAMDPFVEDGAPVQFVEELPAGDGRAAPQLEAAPSAPIVASDPVGAAGASGAFVPGACDPAPLSSSGARANCMVHHGPVLTHTRIYDGMDRDVTQALQGYAYFRDDLRSAGWESYLRRSDEYVRFCCRLHIAETLSARGGAHKTQVLWRWPDGR